MVRENFNELGDVQELGEDPIEGAGVGLTVQVRCATAIVIGAATDIPDEHVKVAWIAPTKVAPHRSEVGFTAGEHDIGNLLAGGAEGWIVIDREVGRVTTQ